MSSSGFPLLFSPFRLGDRQAPNRIVSTSHGTNMAIDGAPGETLIAYHAAKAAGGCGTVMMFGSAAASSLTPIAGNHVNLWNDATVAGLTAAATAVKAYGSLALSQVTSMGRRTFNHANVIGRGPSDTVGEVSYQVPHVLAIDEIEQFVEDYASACLRLKDCGFDGADLAFYDDQLPDQFWDAQVNRRTDRYGGSLENRMRFSLDVIEAIRGAVGRDFIVGARVSGDDLSRTGLQPDDLQEIIQRLDRTGWFDYFTVTGGTITTFLSRGYNIPPAYLGFGNFVEMAGRIKERISTPVIVTGRIVTPAQAEAVLASGAADMVGMTRALIADPDLPNKAKAGLSDEIRVCMGSNEGCIDRLYFGLPVGCVQNPVIGREREWATLISAERPKRVVVVGGGPAGMETARVAAERGHEVVLFERQDRLGGAIRVACLAPGWEAYENSVNWLERQIRKLQIDLRIGEEAAAEDVLALAPEAVVIATGAKARRPYLPGADLPLAVTVADVLTGARPIGRKVVILDETGYTPGPKAADALSLAGHEVEIVTRQYSLGEDIGTTVRAILHERLMKRGVTITTLTEPLELLANGVRVRHVMTGNERLLPADTVVFSSSGVAQDGLYHELKAEGFGNLYLIGDAFAPRHLRHAMVDGARTGRAIG
jgi:2,4-dienoyl-CoA reductase-like NADH-dependent reductase (Old Yellow Enzyme family)/thioredoxin reductase